ncbi:glycosyltransferase family 4 protein [Nakamurella endophytica]|uniref:phosphatidyl-myo-inositol dimannoside synthase n=1 Tax=Nakamurella endophytica TaxID=1748367 RepID=A0A917WLD0_9ACTN|nr:glycosyltransferase family 4 protein [Nakamurella endophytica]GGM12645.1 GDP-mannose-dependent alpha-(1-6)-phosphatidylinositol monomannoside mannosyltransferase [Nakamurella endophytica]
MRRTLLLTNDFPPRTGGIQSYLYELAVRLPAADLVVYAPDWPGAAEFDAALPFPVVRHPTSLMLPVPAVTDRARHLVDRHGIEAVWFGAAAPLALLAPVLRRAGVRRVLASTHGHEVGWSMLPVARQALRSIGRGCDVVTFVSRYARHRTAAALGPGAALEYLPPGVDAEVFRPDPAARAALRDRYGLGSAPVVVCVSRMVRRKGQDALVRAWPQVRRGVPGAVLVLVGDGPDRPRVQRLAADGLADGSIRMTGSVPQDELAAHYALGDLFAMPCRTRGGGLDVEGLGIVFLEASATGLPVVAGDSGGAPEAVQDGRTGTVVDGRDTGAVAEAVLRLLADPAGAAAAGATGRRWVAEQWTWDRSARRLSELLSR